MNEFECSFELNWMNFKNQNEWNLRQELNEISWDPEWMKFEIGNEWNSRLKSDNKKRDWISITRSRLITQNRVFIHSSVE